LIEKPRATVLMEEARELLAIFAASQITARKAEYNSTKAGSR
jgi:hypothetical protein